MRQGKSELNRVRLTGKMQTCELSAAAVACNCDAIKVQEAVQLRIFGLVLRGKPAQDAIEEIHLSDSLP